MTDMIRIPYVLIGGILNDNRCVLLNREMIESLHEEEVYDPASLTKLRTVTRIDMQTGRTFYSLQDKDLIVTSPRIYPVLTRTRMVNEKCIHGVFLSGTCVQCREENPEWLNARE